ncbi:MAG: hypothetical protein AB8B81_02495 [Halioglobus sp.]
MKALLLICIPIFLSACSNKQIYDNIQDNQRLECSKLPQQQYEDCMKDYDTSYEEYQRDRQDLEKEQGK